MKAGVGKISNTIQCRNLSCEKQKAFSAETEKQKDPAKIEGI